MAYLFKGLMVSKEDPSSYQRSIAMGVGEITAWIIIQISGQWKQAATNLHNYLSK